MSSIDKELISGKVIIEFTLPKLHKGKHSYVDFFAFDPARGCMRRKKYMLDRYRRARDRERMAARRVTAKLIVVCCIMHRFVTIPGIRQGRSTEKGGCASRWNKDDDFTRWANQILRNGMSPNMFVTEW